MKIALTMKLQDILIPVYAEDCMRYGDNDTGSEGIKVRYTHSDFTLIRYCLIIPGTILTMETITVMLLLLLLMMMMMRVLAA